MHFGNCPKVKTTLTTTTLRGDRRMTDQSLDRVREQLRDAADWANPEHRVENVVRIIAEREINLRQLLVRQVEERYIIVTPYKNISELPQEQFKIGHNKALTDVLAIIKGKAWVKL